MNGDLPVLLRTEVDSADSSGGQRLRLVTDAGPITSRLHAAVGEERAGIVWVFGSGGGLGGPAGGIYERLACQLRLRGVTSLQVDYRSAARLEPCVFDVLAGVLLLEQRGLSRIVLVGHSFGGAVVIGAAGVRDSVVGVAALSSQLSGTSGVAALGTRALLLVHGEADEVLPASGSRNIHARAVGPKELVLYPGCRHGLDECRDPLDQDLTGWLERVLRL